MSTPWPSLAVCEHCGRPATGVNRCPHAIDKRYSCPNNKQAQADTKNRMKHIGR